MLYAPSGFHTDFLFPTVLRRGACFLFTVEPERKGRVHSGEQNPKCLARVWGVLNGKRRGLQRQLSFSSTF